jgi:hypothetical protein
MVIQRETPDKGIRSEGANPFGDRLRELVAQMRADGVDALRISSELKSFAQELER